MVVAVGAPNSLVQFSDGRLFASGATQYFVGQPGELVAGRLLVEVAVEGQRTVAAVDTGGFYFVCHPSLAGELSPRLTDPLPMGDTGDITLEIRGTSYRGRLYLLTVELLAGEGHGLPVQAAVFVPILAPHQAWELPSIIGFQGMLDRIRFAVDPDDSLFYFGPLGEM